MPTALMSGSTSPSDRLKSSCIAWTLSIVIGHSLHLVGDGPCTSQNQPQQTADPPEAGPPF